MEILSENCLFGSCVHVLKCCFLVFLSVSRKHGNALGSERQRRQTFTNISKNHRRTCNLQVPCSVKRRSHGLAAQERNLGGVQGNTTNHLKRAPFFVLKTHASWTETLPSKAFHKDTSKSHDPPPKRSQLPLTNQARVYKSEVPSPKSNQPGLLLRSEVNHSKPTLNQPLP